MSETIDVIPQLPHTPESSPVPTPVVPADVTPVPTPVVPAEVTPVPAEVTPVPTPVVPAEVTPVPTPADSTASILQQVAKQLKSFLAGNKITLANLTGVIIDLYNFIQSFKSLTTNQKSMMMVTVLREFVISEMDNDPIMIAVVETLVPRVMETLVGVSSGNINIGEMVEDIVEDVTEDIREKASGCLSCFSKLFKK
jgi:hypothetical protein